MYKFTFTISGISRDQADTILAIICQVVELLGGSLVGHFEKAEDEPQSKAA